MKIVQLFLLIGLSIGIGYRIHEIHAYAQAGPAISQTYGLTLEREDFTATAGQTTFAAQVATRSTFALVFRNGELQRLGPDYTQSGNLTVALTPATQAGEFVTLLYYR